MNELDYKKKAIEDYWRYQRDNTRCPVERAEFERRIQSMKKDLPAEAIDEMYQEVTKGQGNG